MLGKILLNVFIHPFEQYDDIKNKKNNYLPTAFLVLFLLLLASIVEFQFTDYVFNNNRTDRLNIWLMIFQTVVIFMMWVLSNWAFCTLFDGEGTLKQIFIVSSLSLFPYIISLFLKTFLSTFMIEEEGIFLVWLLAIGRIYSVVLLFTGLKSLHNFTVKKTLFSILISLLGIAIILFLIMLLFSLVQQVGDFFLTISTELTLIFGG